MKFRPLPSRSYLNESMDYNPATGILVWKKRPREHFKNNQAHSRWNNRYPGKEAFGYPLADGRKYGAIGNKWFLAHRIIWKLVTGKDPVRLPDHKDRNGSNNRWGNLRLATHAQNSANHSLRSDNKSGHAGVRYNKRDKAWVVQITSRRRRIHVGSFRSESDAVAARKMAEAKHHKNFAPDQQVRK